MKGIVKITGRAGFKLAVVLGPSTGRRWRVMVWRHNSLKYTLPQVVDESELAPIVRAELDARQRKVYDAAYRGAYEVGS